MQLNLKFFSCLIFLLLNVVPFKVFAQTQQNYVIAGIAVEGNKFSDESTIITLSGLRPGENITLPGDNKLQLAIRNLWQRKQFSDIEIKVDRITPVGVFLIIRLKEFNRLNKIIPEGNKEIDNR